jgi:hypothetical protein
MELKVRDWVLLLIPLKRRSGACEDYPMSARLHTDVVYEL